MDDFRSNPPKQFCGSKVVLLQDYEKQSSIDVTTGKATPIKLPKSNVLQFTTEDGSKITVRPSGTEPKIKFYFGVKGALTGKQEFESVNKQLDDKIKMIVAELGLNK